MRHRLSAIVVLLIAVGAGAAVASSPALGAGAPAASAASAGAIVGVWTGSVTQQGQRPYEVLMAVKPSGQTLIGKTAYPSLDCEGDLTLTGLHGNSYVFREHIYLGAARCSNGGTIVATVSGNSMSWRWTQGGSQVVGVLHRVVTDVTISGAVHARLTALPHECSVSKGVRTIQVDGTDSGGASVTLTVTDEQRGGWGQILRGGKVYFYKGSGRLVVNAKGASFRHVVMPEDDGVGHGKVTVNGQVSC